jgi:hypothetical protein
LQQRREEQDNQDLRDLQDDVTKCHAWCLAVRARGDRRRGIRISNFTGARAVMRLLLSTQTDLGGVISPRGG